MKTLTVSLPGREYRLVIAPGLLDRAGERCRAVLPGATRVGIVTDSNVAPLFAGRLVRSLERRGFQAAVVTVPAGERSKSMAMLEYVYDQLLSFGLTRTDAVVALGGGVVGDLAGFAAATLLRGVDLVHIPTTLLAQVDSSVGGKVAVNLRAGKNLAGTFWQPKLVLMDPDLLDTLDDRTFADGMAEVIKYGCIFDRALFETLEQNPSRAAVMERIQDVLHTCCACKRAVVEEDERDTGARMLLNFGHTLGHAYELAGDYERYTHGQAVAAGMCRAAQLGAQLGVTPDILSCRIADLVRAFGLPDAISCSMSGYAAAIGLDKKGAGDCITLILLSSLGTAVPVRLEKRTVLGLLEGFAI
ncbi:MAG: 3-dehydroquinate synthase [Clostridia bacterium]|nr:3-dehydroquinate synthase [Clostridia bacterium]